ncbi:hypothetical protein G6F56_011845 [Rhizopus delemar]|nr:hypothetical protein G6F56_011845 [Rhizopus delemar]
MNIQFLFENGKGSLINEYGRPEPIDYIVDEEQFRLETLSSHTQYLAQPASGEREKDRCNAVKRDYTCYSDQDKVKFFKLLFERCLCAAAAAKQLEIHVRTVQYEKDPDSIYEKRRKTGRPRTFLKYFTFRLAIV